MKRIGWLKAVCLMVIAAMICVTAAAGAESYSAGTMRLLRFEGEVGITDAGGSERFVMENARFGSGETMRTGGSSSASVSLDSSKIVSLDEVTTVGFTQEGSAMTLALKEGTIFLDVSEKLDANETFEIETSTMTIGIRGTIVYATESPEGTVLGVLEGTAEVTVKDGEAGKTISVPAGQRLVLPGEDQTREIAPDDLGAFVLQQIQADEAVRERVENACPQLLGTKENTEEPYPADGNWAFSGSISLVAQSASKLYDGTPLMRTGDVLAIGLPAEFSYTATAKGSQTEAGESANEVGTYSIFNGSGENVTGHFSLVETVAGKLVVDPLPMSIWTGSAEKSYDGTPLTNPEAGFSVRIGQAGGEDSASMSFAVTGADGTESLYGAGGTVLVHGTNPLTGETAEYVLTAGQKLSVQLNEAGETIQYAVEEVGAEDIPEELLRLYADNPALLAQACAETGWDQAKISELIAALPEGDAEKVVKGNVSVDAGKQEDLIGGLANVIIKVDTEGTDFSGRALNDNEARYTEVPLEAKITVTATGSQTEPGESPNTYEIEWGGTNPNNYVVSEELGTLHVHKPGKTLKFNYIEPDCQHEGSYTQAVRCELCGKTLSRQDKTTGKGGHKPGRTEKSNERKATCTSGGSYTETVYCSVCGAKISSSTKTTPKGAHRWSAIESWEEETDGGYEYWEEQECSVCGERRTVRTGFEPYDDDDGDGP